MASKTVWLLMIAFIFLTLTTHFALVTSDFEEEFCSKDGNYTSDSSYGADLNTLLRNLSSNMGDSGFYSASAGEVNAVALCRADIQLSECRDCINVVADEILQYCPYQLEAVMWEAKCMVRYSNQSILGKLAMEPEEHTSTDEENPPSYPYTYADELVALIDVLGDRAAKGGALRKAAAGKRPAVNETVYAMAQCTPDLSPEDCTTCLANISAHIASTHNRSGGYIFYRPSCTMRFGTQSFYNITRLLEALEPSMSTPAAGNDNRTRNIIIAAVSVVGILTVAFCVGIFVRKRMKLKRKGEYERLRDIESIRYDFREIREATNDFSDENKLGQGGFGIVYKGKLKNDQEIAVKKLSNNSHKASDADFKNEVMSAARLQHKNLVRLLGFSLEGNERLLVFELVKNGSLDRFIFDSSRSSNFNWQTRYEIIEGVATGLLYLHKDSGHQIIHRDLKASNVLLDEKMTPKISDFGLAKTLVQDAPQEKTSTIVGTDGYMAPEYRSKGQFSIKSDVYSFGVLMLEIVAGEKKKCFQNDETVSGDLLSCAWRSWREGTSVNMIDQSLMASSAAKPEMVRCIQIALLCVQKNPDDRPTMDSVIEMLRYPRTLQFPSEPGFYTPSSFSKASASDSQGQA